MVDLRVKTPARFFFAGPSQCGKTYRVFRFLEWADYMFDKPKIADRVFYFYNVWTEEFERNRHLVYEWINMCPTAKMMEEKANLFKESDGCIMIIDDFGTEMTKDIVPFFTRSSHHFKVTGFLLNQNLFPRSNFSKDITLNITHTLIFNNPKENLQIDCFCRQMKPRGWKQIANTYRKATKGNSRSYVWFDHAQETPEYLRIKSNMVPDEWPPVVWIDEENEENK